MFDFLIYLGQSSLCLAALYLIYKVAMSNETLHLLNRVLLLGSVVLSAVMPLCRVKVVKEYDAAPTIASIEFDDVVVAEVANLGVDYVALLKDVAVMVFLIGVAFMVARLAVGIYSVWRLIHSGPVSVIEEDVTLTVVDNISSPFSWFGHIVISENDVHNFRRMILEHELAHIRLRHSWDVMAVDMALCLWWFNPAMWLLKRELQNLHEYQADDAVLNSGIDAKTYQMLLIKRAVGPRLHSVANCLNHSTLKNRITMMCKKTSSRWAAAKALLVVPMVAVALSAFATTVYVPREVQDKVTENSLNLQDDENKPVYVVEGKVVAYDDMNKLDPSTIAQMEVLKEEKAKNEYVAKHGLNISAEEVKNGLVVITLKKDGRSVTSPEATKGAIVIAGKSSAEKVSLREALQMSLRGVEGLYGVAKAEVTVNPDGSFDKVNISCNSKEDDKDLTPLVNEVSRALHSAIKRAELPAKKTKYSYDISFCIQTDDGVLQSNVPVSDDAIVVMTYGGSKAAGQPKTQSSTIKIVGNGDQTKITTVQLNTQGEGKKTLIVNGKEMPYEYRDIISSENIKEIVINKLDDGSSVVNITLKPEFEQQQKDQPYIKVEKMPTFQGGDLNTFRNWIQGQIQYPAEAAAKGISGRVVFSFAVEKDGSTSDYTVLASPDKSLADEVERIFKTCPKWEPGTQGGETVRVKYTVPIVFAMQGEAK